MEGVATLFSASFGGYILMLVKDSSSHLSLYEELRNLQADIHWVAKVLTHCFCMEQNYIGCVDDTGEDPPTCKMAIF